MIALLGARFWPAGFAVADRLRSQTDPNVQLQADAASELPVVIDDQAPPAGHLRPSPWRALRTLGVGCVLWLLPLVALRLSRSDSLHTQVYLFFSKAALVTFGGAYAVLAYVTQVATKDYGWLGESQAIDGLALAETTPGPLIMVLQFVGFMAGWNHSQGDTPTTSAVVAALATTYATFLPCFLFILIGAPYIEVLRSNRNLTSALAGITASVVGVILNLSLIFGVAVVFPHQSLGRPDWFAASMSIAAFVAIFRYRWQVIWIVLAGGILGLVRGLLTPLLS